MYCVYAVKSLKTGRIYIGQTKNMESRLSDHNLGRVQSTKRDKPWELYALQRVLDRKEAMNLEWKLKKSRGIRLIWLKENAISDP